MAKKVKDLMLALSEYAVVDESATVMDALEALEEAQEHVPPDRQPHRAVLIRGAGGEIVGKIHHFAFLRALIPDRKAMGAREIMDRAGVGDELREASMQTLDLLTADLVDVTERLRHVTVREVYRAVTTSIDEDAPLLDATPKFLQHQTLSLLVTRRGVTVGILRLSDFFDEISRQALRGESSGERS
jgi:CBS domain-containing protein